MSIRQGSKIIAGAVDGVKLTGDTMTGDLKITNPGRPYSALNLKGNEVIWNADQVYDTNKYLGQIHFLDKNDNWGGYLQCWKDKYDAVGIGFGARRKEGNNADVAIYQRKDGSIGFYIDGKELSSFCCEKKYNSDGSWYRRYSDGWLEQSGWFNGGGGGWQGVKCTYLKPFKDTKYQLICLGNWSDASASSCRITAKRTTGADVTVANNTANIQNNMWYALGLGA